MTESRFALLLLRAGYPHIYIPAPPNGINQWLVYRITRHADFIPEDHALFSQPDADMACDDERHILMGMKVVSIPQAHKFGEIWMAFSANFWDDRHLVALFSVGHITALTGAVMTIAGR